MSKLPDSPLSDEVIILVFNDAKKITDRNDHSIPLGSSIDQLFTQTLEIEHFLQTTEQQRIVIWTDYLGKPVEVQLTKQPAENRCFALIRQPGFKTAVGEIPIQRILDSCLDEIFITDGTGHVLFINEAGRALYGVDPEELIGRHVADLEAAGYYSPSLFPLVATRREKVSMIQRTKTGKITHCIASPSEGEAGELAYVIFNARDITEIKHLREKVERNSTLLDSFASELHLLRQEQKMDEGFIALSPKMRKIDQLLSKVAPFDTTILLMGESGVGKGIVAEQIHKRSHRNKKELVHINCGAIPANLLEAELFGYEEGAFTGAKQGGRVGLIERAAGGTLFLDEIGEMPLDMQVKLLKVLQERMFTPVGSSTPVQADIRIIAATNQELEQRVQEGAFREDLYYRLNVVPIHLPSLNERPEDVAYMIDAFLQRFNERYHCARELSLEAENVLYRYTWPGNVRELENVIERLVVTADEDLITMDNLPIHLIRETAEKTSAIEVTNIVTLKQAQEQMEEQLIRKAYEIDTSSYKIAQMLGINQSTAHRKIQQYIKKP